MTKISTSRLATFTAIAVVLAAPALAVAKTTSTAANHSLTHALVKPLTVVKPTPVHKTVTTSGQVVSENNGVSKNGDGSWTKTVTFEGNGKRVVVTTTTYADGVTVTKTADITADKATHTVVDDASIVTTQGGTSKTVTRDSTDTNVGGGVTDISAVITNAKGKQTDLTGTDTVTKENYGSDAVLDLTNTATNKSENLNIEHLKSADASASIVTGTGFNGQAVNRATLRTTNTQPNSQTGVNTGDGSFTYSSTSQTVNGVTTVNSQRTYSDGQTSSSSKTSQTNPDGTKTVDGSDSNTYTNGYTASTSYDETVTPTGTGQTSASGTFTHTNQNGTQYSGSLTGSTAATNYGNVYSTTYTDPSVGVGSSTINTTQLVVGDATLNVHTGTTWGGSATSSAGLVNGTK